MPTSIIASRIPSFVPWHSDSVLSFVLLLFVSVTLALATGCEPTAPRGSTSTRSAPDADAPAKNGGILPDAAAESPRSAAALANASGDASVERSTPISGMPGCASIGSTPTSDAGVATTPPPDSGGGDVVRSAGAPPLAIDGGHDDGTGTDTLGGGDASGGAMGSGVGGIGGGRSSNTGGGTGSGAVGSRENAGGGGTTIGGGGVFGAGGVFGGQGGAGAEGSLAPSPGSGDLAIVELLINPAGTDTGREWIEIVNRTTHTLNLSGLNISDAANDAAVTFGTGTVAAAFLPAGAWAVLIQSADPAKNGGVAIGAATPGGSFGTLVSLNNDADTISICVGPCANGAVIDSVSWDATLGTGYDGHALVVDDSGRRCPATLPFGDGGSFGSPGVANGRCP